MCPITFGAHVADGAAAAAAAELSPMAQPFALWAPLTALHVCWCVCVCAWCDGLRSGIMSKGYAISEMHFATNAAVVMATRPPAPPPPYASHLAAGVQAAEKYAYNLVRTQRACELWSPPDAPATPRREWNQRAKRTRTHGRSVCQHRSSPCSPLPSPTEASEMFEANAIGSGARAVTPRPLGGTSGVMVTVAVLVQWRRRCGWVVAGCDAMGRLGGLCARPRYGWDLVRL